MTDEIFSRPVRQLSDRDLYAVLTSLTLADESLSFLAAYEMLDRSVRDTGPNVSTWEAISSTGRDPAAIQLDVDTCRRLRDAKRELDRRSERSLKTLAAAPGDTTADGGDQTPRLSDAAFEKVMSSRPCDWQRYARIRRTGEGYRYADGDDAPARFGADDRLYAASNQQDLVRQHEQGDANSRIAAASRSAQGQLERAVQTGRTPGERKLLLQQSIRIANKQLDAVLDGDEFDTPAYEPPTEVRHGPLVQLGDF